MCISSFPYCVDLDHDTAATCCDTIDGSTNHTKRPTDIGSLKQIYSVLAGSFAIRRFPTFCAVLVGGYTFLQWPLRLFLGYASILSIGRNVPSISRNASRAASRFLAAVISAWFSLEVLNYKAIAKVGRKDSNELVQDQQQQVANVSPPALAGKTVDLTLLAVARALDSLIVNTYRRSYLSFAKTASVSSTWTGVSQYADTLIFSLSSGTVVCLPFRAGPS